MLFRIFFQKFYCPNIVNQILKLGLPFLLFAFLASKTMAQELSFWQFWNSEWISPAISEFEKQNPGIKINVEKLTWSGGREKIITAMSAGEAPDVMEIGSSWSPEFMSSGGLLDISDAAVGLSLFNLESATYQNKIYGLPWTVSVAAVYYNKDLLQKAGYTNPPTTWDEFLTQVKDIKSLGDDIYGFGIKLGTEVTWQRFLPFAWSNGADLLDENGKVQVTSPAFIETLEFYKNLNQFALADDNLTTRKSFLRGKIGFLIEDPGQMNRFAKNAEDLNFGVAPLPNAPRTGYHKAFSGTELLIISKDTKYPKLAKRFIIFMVQLKNTKLLTDKVNTLFPAEKNAAAADFYLELNPLFEVFLSELEFAKSPVVHPLWADMQKALVLNVEKVIYSRLTPSEAANELSLQLNNILSY